jgi:AcrR family transcriptional regulator
MQQEAVACGTRKATLYHYVRDKHDLLTQICKGHVLRLETLVQAVRSQGLPPQDHLQALIHHFMQAYASAQNEHRVLTEDVRFLADDERTAVLDGQRRVVLAFGDAVAALRPELARQRLHKPLAMLLFGMMNWTFTWLRAEGELTHASLAPLVTELFLGGLPAVRVR